MAKAWWKISPTIVLHRSSGNMEEGNCLPRSKGAPLHTMMLFEPMNRTAASDETETLWHVGRGSSPCPLDPRVVNYIRRGWRKWMSLLAAIHAPHCKTLNTTATVGTNATKEGVVRWPSDTNLTRARDRQEDRATCSLVPPIRTSPRWRKSRSRLFRCGAISTIHYWN